jgi:hypothetical protein
MDLLDEIGHDATPDAPTVTEGHMMTMLDARYSAVNPANGPRYVTARHVRSHAGFDARRTADYVALDTWQSHLALHGHEIKVSRSDWLAELKKPEKAAEFTPYMHYWWIVAAYAGIVRDGELPDGWGLIVPRGGRLVATKRAVYSEADPMPLSRLAAFARAICVRGGQR